MLGLNLDVFKSVKIRFSDSTMYGFETYKARFTLFLLFLAHPCPKTARSQGVCQMMEEPGNVTLSNVFHLQVSKCEESPRVLGQR